MAGPCDDCGKVRSATYKDINDGQYYCRECWLEFYGAPPPPQAVKTGPSFAPTPVLERLKAQTRAQTAASISQGLGQELLPEDAPRGHAAHAAARYNTTHKNPLVSFTWRSGGQRIPFQTTVAAVGGSRHAAEVIARACYMKFEQGWTKEQVLQFRSQCYARFRGSSVISPQVSQRAQEVPQNYQSPGSRAPENCQQGQRGCGAYVQAHQSCQGTSRSLRTTAVPQMELKSEQLQQELLPQQLRLSPPGSSGRQQLPHTTQEERRLRSSHPPPGSFVPARYLRLLLDDPQAALHKNSSVKCVRSQGFSQDSLSIAGQDEGLQGMHSRVHQAEASCVPHGGREVQQPSRHVPDPIIHPSAHSFGARTCLCTCGGNSGGRAAKKDPRGLFSKGDVKECEAQRKVSPSKRDQDLRGAKRTASDLDSQVGSEETPKKVLRKAEPEPESQHRECSQPTPFCFGEPPPMPDKPCSQLSIPTPQLEEITPWVESQPVPVTKLLEVIESVPTPWWSQPTPKLDISDLQYTMDPTPVLENEEQPTTPISSLPTPVPAALGVVAVTEHAVAVEDKAEEDAMFADTAVDVSDAAPGAAPAAQPRAQDLACATASLRVSLDVPPPPAARKPFRGADSVNPTVSLDFAPAPAVIKNDTNTSGQAKGATSFAALLLQRSRAAAAVQPAAVERAKLETPTVAAQHGKDAAAQPGKDIADTAGSMKGQPAQTARLTRAKATISFPIWVDEVKCGETPRVVKGEPEPDPEEAHPAPNATAHDMMEIPCQAPLRRAVAATI